MTSKYDEAVFEFLTKEENFSAAYEISDNFPKIKDRLIEGFWEEVKGYLLKKVKEENKNWEIYKEFATRYSKLGFQFTGTPIKVIFEDLSGRYGKTYYGIWINFPDRHLYENTIKNSTILKDLIKNKGMKSNKWVWLAYEYTSYNFQTKEILERILPHNRSEFSKDLADLLFEFTKEVEEPIILGFEKTNP